MSSSKSRGIFDPSKYEQVAGNGLLHRRALLGRGFAIAGAGIGLGSSAAVAAPVKDDE